MSTWSIDHILFHWLMTMHALSDWHFKIKGAEAFALKRFHTEKLCTLKNSKLYRHFWFITANSSENWFSLKLSIGFGKNIIMTKFVLVVSNVFWMKNETSFYFQFEVLSFLSFIFFLHLWIIPLFIPYLSLTNTS